MSSKFEIWNNRITEATDELSRRKLIGELGMWRAAHLSDIPAMRSSAFGMSRLYMLVGDHASAVREAHSLYSLCQTAPEATREEFKKAKAYLRSLGLTVKDSGELVEREKKAPKNPRKDVVELLGAGKIDAALKLLRNRRGPTSTLFHIWIELTSALKKGSDAESLEAFRQVQEKLTSHLHLDKKPATKVKQPKTEQRSADNKKESRPDMLATWMGLDSLPRKREARIRFLEEYLRENPTKLDSLVAQALKGHVEEEGLKRTAPWLAGFVVRALISSPSGETRTQLDQLLEQGAYAVTAYEEEGAKRGIALLASAMGSGWEYQGFRRGVLRDNRLDSLKVWTVRLSKGPSQRMVAVTSAKLEELDDKLIERIFGTVKRLSSSALLWLDVESSRLTGLAEAAGLFCYTGEDHETILTELENLPEPAPQERREAKRSELGDLLRGEKVPEVEALVPLVKGYRRTFQCFEASRGLTDESLPAIGERFAALLKAAHEVAPETARLNEGQTIVVSQLAQEPEGPIKTMLESEALLTRYGGPSLYTLGALSQILLEKGWLLQRAVVGTTRREREEHAELGDLAAGLWRLLVSQEGREGEVWYLSTCQADTVSSLGALLQDKRPTIVVYPSDSPAADWTAGLDLGCAEWGDSGALSAALDRLQSSSS